jgi:hypothetical protein
VPDSLISGGFLGPGAQLVMCCAANRCIQFVFSSCHNRCQLGLQHSNSNSDASLTRDHVARPPFSRLASIRRFWVKADHRAVVSTPRMIDGDQVHHMVGFLLFGTISDVVGMVALLYGTTRVRQSLNGLNTRRLPTVQSNTQCH